jgi:hypothetical protein
MNYYVISGTENIKKEMEVREVIIKLRCDGTILRGFINIHGSDKGKFRRTSDFLNNSTKFIIVFDAINDGISSEALIINIQDISWVSDYHEQKGAKIPNRNNMSRQREIVRRDESSQAKPISQTVIEQQLVEENDRLTEDRKNDQKDMPKIEKKELPFGIGKKPER